MAVKSQLFFTYSYFSANITGVLRVVLIDIDPPSSHWSVVKKADVLIIVKMLILIHFNSRDAL